MLVSEVLEQGSMVPTEHLDAEGHGSGRGLFPTQPGRPPLRIGETRERLAQRRGRRETAVQDLGEPLDLGLCQVDPSQGPPVLLPAQPFGR